MADQATDTASAALLRLAECIRDYTEDLRNVTWLAPFSASEMMARDRWLADEFDKFADEAEAAVASLPAPAPTLMEIADDIRTWAIVIGQSSIENPIPLDAEKEGRIADVMSRWVEQVRYQAEALASLPAPATDTASAALRAAAERVITDADIQDEDMPPDSDGRFISAPVLRALKAALASLPAPATDSAALLKRLRFDFIDGLDGAILPEDDRRFVKECLDQAIANYVKALASLPAPAAPEHAKGCQRGWDGCSCGVDAAPVEENTRLREALGGTSERVGIAGFIRRMMPYLPDQFWKDSAEEMAQLCERSLRPQEPR